MVLFAPANGVKLGLCEAEADVEPAFGADIRGEALSDFLTLWTLVVAAVLLIIDHRAWPYFGLAGGATYVYFAIRGISARVAMRQRGMRIGSTASVKAAFVFLTIWGVMGLATIIAAASELTLLGT